MVPGSPVPLSVKRRDFTLRRGKKPRKTPISPISPDLAPPTKKGPKWPPEGPRDPDFEPRKHGLRRLSLLTRPGNGPENPFIRSPPGGPGGPNSGISGPPGGQGSPAGGPGARGRGNPRGAGGIPGPRGPVAGKSEVTLFYSRSLVHAG